jgi:hypothetical protein
MQITDMLSFVIGVSAASTGAALSANEISAEFAAWKRYNDHVAVVGYAVTAVSTLLGVGAIAALGNGLFHAYKQAKGMAIGITMLAASKGIGAVKASEASRAVAAKEQASQIKEEQAKERTYMQNISSAGGVNVADIKQMFSYNPKGYFHKDGFYGYRKEANGSVTRLDNSNTSNLDNLDFVAVDTEKMRDFTFEDFADRVRDGGTFAAVNKHGITATFQKTGTDFFETTHGVNITNAPGINSAELRKKFYT